jgi:hypothetical protein
MLNCNLGQVLAPNPLKASLYIRTDNGDYQQQLQAMRHHCAHLARQWSEIVFPPECEQSFNLFSLITSSTRTFAMINVCRLPNAVGSPLQSPPGPGFRLSVETMQIGEVVMTVQEHYQAGSGQVIVLEEDDWEE